MHIKSALLDQLNKHLHVMVFGEFSQEIQNKLAQKLATFLPESLNCLYVVNSGQKQTKLHLN